jgi:hypothetical protein
MRSLKQSAASHLKLIRQSFDGTWDVTIFAELWALISGGQATQPLGEAQLWSCQSLRQRDGGSGAAAKTAVTNDPLGQPAVLPGGVYLSTNMD